MITTTTLIMDHEAAPEISVTTGLTQAVNSASCQQATTVSNFKEIITPPTPLERAEPLVNDLNNNQEQSVLIKKNCVSIGTQTEPNLIDKLIDNHVKKHLDDGCDLYQEYVRSAQCAQFWPLDKNPIRSLVPSMIKVDLPEQYLKNESLMFDLVQAITNNSKLVNLLAKYIHHIVPNVIISKRIDLIPLITCTIRVCRDSNEQERLLSLLFNLIKRPNEEQRRMILSGIIVILQVSPDQSSSLLLPNLWDHVNDKFPERRILLAESCSTLAHYVRPIMRTNLVLSILIQLLKDKNAAVRAAACKSFACLLTLIMDRNDEVFDACLSAMEDIIQDVLQQTPVNFCEFRYELEQMRFCALETVYPLLCMWAVKLNRFKVELAEFYLIKAEKYSNQTSNVCDNNTQAGHSTASMQEAALKATATSSTTFPQSSSSSASPSQFKSNSIFASTKSSLFSSSRRHSSYAVGSGAGGSLFPSATILGSKAKHQAAGHLVVDNSSLITHQRAIGAYMRMLNYLIPFVFSDAVYGCAWLSKSNLHLNNICQLDLNNNSNNPGEQSASQQVASNQPKPNLNLNSNHNPSKQLLFDGPLNFTNKLLDPSLIIDESAIVAFHDQLEQEHMIESLDWILSTFLPKFLRIISQFSNKKFYQINCPSQQPAACKSGAHAPSSACSNTSAGSPAHASPTGSPPAHHPQQPQSHHHHTGLMQEFLVNSIRSIRQLCLLFGKHLTRTKLRPLIKAFIQKENLPQLYPIYIASLTSFEPIEQHEFEEIVSSIRNQLSLNLIDMNKNDVELLAITIKIIATNEEQISSPTMRQKFLTYVLDALLNCSNQILKSSSAGSKSVDQLSQQQAKQSSAAESLKSRLHLRSKQAKLKKSCSLDLEKQLKTKEYLLIIFRHILTCLIDLTSRPPDWAHILVTKFLPLLISLANDDDDSQDVYICTYARLMCAQLVETFDNFLNNNPKMTKQLAETMLPALKGLKILTEQIRASNLSRQIESLHRELNEKYFLNEARE